jgi:hypothetical protein
LKARAIRPERTLLSISPVPSENRHLILLVLTCLAGGTMRADAAGKNASMSWKNAKDKLRPRLLVHASSRRWQWLEDHLFVDLTRSVHHGAEPGKTQTRIYYNIDDNWENIAGFERKNGELYLRGSKYDLDTGLKNAGLLHKDESLESWAKRHGTTVDQLEHDGMKATPEIVEAFKLPSPRSKPRGVYASATVLLASNVLLETSHDTRKEPEDKGRDPFKTGRVDSFSFDMQHLDGFALVGVQKDALMKAQAELPTMKSLTLATKLYRKSPKVVNLTTHTSVDGTTKVDSVTLRYPEEVSGPLVKRYEGEQVAKVLTPAALKQLDALIKGTLLPMAKKSAP